MGYNWEFETNKECKKYGFRNHTLYWIKDIVLKSKIGKINNQ